TICLRGWMHGARRHGGGLECASCDLEPSRHSRGRPRLASCAQRRTHARCPAHECDQRRRDSDPDRHARIPLPSLPGGARGLAARDGRVPGRSRRARKADCVRLAPPFVCAALLVFVLAWLCHREVLAGWSVSEASAWVSAKQPQPLGRGSASCSRPRTPVMRTSWPAVPWRDGSTKDTRYTPRSSREAIRGTMIPR